MYPWVEVEPQCTPGWRWTEEERLEERCITRDGDDVEQPPHGLGADVAEPVLGHQQLAEVEGHLPRHRALHLPPPVRVLTTATQNQLQPVTTRDNQLGLVETRTTSQNQLE